MARRNKENVPAPGVSQEKPSRKRIHVNKLPILLPAAAAALVLGVYAALNLAPAAGAAQQVSLGQRHLEEMDYSSALLSFSQAIQVDPSNTQAKLGLAQAYMGLGDYAAAQDVVNDMGDAAETPEALQVQLDIAVQTGETGQAVEQIWNLIQATDEDGYYTQLEELLAEHLSRPHSLDAGDDQQAVIWEGALYTQGSNTLGQLGTEAGLGLPEAVQEDFAEAGFPGAPAKVYCLGRTTFVIDQEDVLWVSGENRWGQKGTQSQDLSPVAGWRQVEHGENAACVAGGTGCAVVLKKDGTLWSMGGGSSGSRTRVAGLPPMQAVSGGQGMVLALSAGGELYAAGPDGSSLAGWQRYASHVRQFSLCEGYLLWLDDEGRFHTADAYPSYLPQEWVQDSCGLAVVQFAAAPEGMLILTQDGELMASGSGGLQTLQEDCSLDAMYTVSRYIVLEHSDGRLQVWNPTGGSLQDVEA